MTIVAVFCSQIILQKSFTVSSLGPLRKLSDKQHLYFNNYQVGLDNMDQKPLMPLLSQHKVNAYEQKKT